MRITAGTTFTPRSLVTVDGRPAPVPDEGRVVHLQLRRFAGCPVCHLHLQSFAIRHGELEAAGIREVVVFHSPAGELRAHTAGLPFAVVAGPDRVLYTALGVGSSWRAIFDPRAW